MTPFPRALPLLALALAACGTRSAPAAPAAAAPASASFTVHDTTIRAVLEASGIAAPVREATLGTMLMGSVTDVLVHEGTRVAAGDLLLRIDARDLGAKEAQAAAGVAQAEAMEANAQAQTKRIRALYPDSAAPRAQLDEAEAGLARAEAGLRAARAMAAEVDALRAYADVRAPFAGTIVKRFVDPGAFVAPGAPLLTLQDARTLRITVSVAPADARGIARGQRLAARIEGADAAAVVEGVVPAPGSALYAVNALVDDAAGRYLPGASAVLLLPLAPHAAILVPERAIVREGELTGAYVRGADGRAALRWIQTGRSTDGLVEVLAGLKAGETVELAAPSAGER